MNFNWLTISPTKTTKHLLYQLQLLPPSPLGALPLLLLMVRRINERMDDMMCLQKARSVTTKPNLHIRWDVATAARLLRWARLRWPLLEALHVTIIIRLTATAAAAVVFVFDYIPLIHLRKVLLFSGLSQTTTTTTADRRQWMMFALHLRNPPPPPQHSVIAS